MSSNATMKNMQNAVTDYVEANLPKDINKAKFGVVQGNKVIIGNKSYGYVPTVDLYFESGDRVACILPDSGNIAAVVGIL